MSRSAPRSSSSSLLSETSIAQRTVVAVALLCLLHGVGCGLLAPEVWVDHYEEHRSDEVIDESLEVAGVTTLRCKTHNGAISITGTDGDTLSFRVRKQAGGADEEDARRCAEAVEIVQRREGDELVVGWRWAEPRKGQWSVGVSFDFEVPRSLALAVRTHNGSVSVAGVESDIEVTTHNGALSLHDCEGRIAARTHNGPIDADVVSEEFRLKAHNGRIVMRNGAPGEISGSVQTHNGRVALALHAGARARLVCSTHRGSMEVPPHAVVTQRGSRSLRGLLHGDLEDEIPAGEVDVRTHNGSIAIE